MSEFLPPRDVLERLASDERIPSDILANLAQRDPELAMLVVSNSSASVNLLIDLAEHHDVTAVRMAALETGRLPRGVLAVLEHDDERNIADAAQAQIADRYPDTVVVGDFASYVPNIQVA